ncbi:hypothetical protein PoB_007187600 [Plakobranchus ocellatus]|uniref:Uncharacterized protein n=1 Tax=Plakobranchus ocellatus TaxID=259542 RepID=A0AAV4DN45_9GAST|nr:hypothetical protein PoB_007187600 [Plakobranchus ocellatus]
MNGEEDILKTAKFCGRPDDLDNWLTWFERFAGMSHWPRRNWAGSLDFYGQLPQAQALEYDGEKKVLMKRYDFIEDGYLCGEKKVLFIPHKRREVRRILTCLRWYVWRRLELKPCVRR